MKRTDGSIPWDWIALNPEIGRALGWEFDPLGVLRWRDASGQIVVESLWWRDGTPSVEMIGNTEAGEGWAVVASRDAVDRISELVGGLKVVRYCVRQSTSEAHEERSSPSTRDIVDLP